MRNFAVPHDSLRTLYSDHHRWLQGWLRHRLGDSSVAADLAQDTFVRLLARQEALALQEPRAFLTTVAHRVLISHWRRQRLERAYLEALACLPEPMVPSEEDRAVLLETIMEIDCMLDGLPMVVKRAFLLSQLDGLTHAQVAGALGVSITTVKRYLVKASMQCYFADAFPAGA